MLLVDPDAERVASGRCVDELLDRARPEVAAEDVARKCVAGIERRAAAGGDALGRGRARQDDRVREGVGGDSSDGRRRDENHRDGKGAEESSHGASNGRIGRCLRRRPSGWGGPGGVVGP